ncbi:peptidoglycan-binding domain-containing protein [Inconstantimicrobium mannanitabidum]|uniref:Uncharacterized protein n=1 Tax=Inconstantimicrobium mannanitabidum TaxID=1604901 RepID=A0ACB5RIS4_9CLOT|nr:peptidoglycan-binding domain-containing protein [Clostridium sp. TW13]GKX68991.1 hypothetical protein rsdtw13_42490 [Clostridium sp. TW13]
MSKTLTKVLAVSLIVLGGFGLNGIVNPKTASACPYHVSDRLGSYPGYVLSMRNESYDSNVAQVQQFLRDLYFSTPADPKYNVYCITVDGHFGPATQAAVLFYQDQHGLSRDGQVGPATWSSMQNHA